MYEQLPTFRYHPDPIATQVIQASTKTCRCCKAARGYIYTGPIYAEQDWKEAFCPWCIASGEVAQRFEATFTDEQPLREAEVPEEIVEEVCKRTPGYYSWQPEVWLTHCGDACAFHGDPCPEDIRNASKETIQSWNDDYAQEDLTWELVTSNYEPNGDCSLFKFVCRHCNLVLFGWDMS